MQFNLITSLLLCSMAAMPTFAAAVPEPAEAAAVPQPNVSPGDQCDCNIGSRRCSLQVNGNSFYYWVRSVTLETKIFPSLHIGYYTDLCAHYRSALMSATPTLAMNALTAPQLLTA